MIRVELPFHLRNLAKVGTEIKIEVASPVTYRALVAVLEKKYPSLRGTIIDPYTSERRPFLRFFANGDDLSHEPLDSALPNAVTDGSEVFLIVGAIAGG